MTQQQYTNLTTKKLDGAEFQISATIPADVLDTFRADAIKELGKDVAIKGFRAGHVPLNMLEEHLGEAPIMDRAANTALSKVYPAIIIAENIDAIGSPRIELKKLAAGNDLEFTATTAVMPTITLPDYKAIAKKIFTKETPTSELEVSNKEMSDTLINVRRQKGQIESYEKQKADGVEQPQMPEMQDDELPELTDDFVQTLGDFATVADFEEKVKENIHEEKKLRAIEKKRIESVEKIIAESKIELPQILIDQELYRMQAQLEEQVAQTGTKLEDYLKNIDKTIDDLRNDWKSEAEKRAKLQLILNAIAKNESISPKSDEVDHEVAHILEHYPKAEEENVRVYVETTKRNEMVFKFLEEAGK